MKIIKLLLAVVLLPFLWSSLRFAFELFTRVGDSWPWHQLLLLSIGSLLATLAFGLLPRPTWLYVFGHETTHALAVWISGGKVSRFRVSSEGGHIISDRISVWIALSPYILPFYPLVVGLAWVGMTVLWPGVKAGQDAFWAIWGLCWGFHFAFTFSVIRTEQPDFSSQGYLFSFVTIALGNLWLLLALFWWWLRPLSLENSFSLLGQLIFQSYHFLWNALLSFQKAGPR